MPCLLYIGTRFFSFTRHILDTYTNRPQTSLQVCFHVVVVQITYDASNLIPYIPGGDEQIDAVKESTNDFLLLLLRIRIYPQLIAISAICSIRPRDESVYSDKLAPYIPFGLWVSFCEKKTLIEQIELFARWILMECINSWVFNLSKICVKHFI